MRAAVAIAYVLCSAYSAVLVTRSVGKTVTLTPRSSSTHVLGCFLWSTAVVYLYASGAGS